MQRRSAINKENRAKLKIVHTSGARSFQRTRALLKNPESNEISPALLYKKTHTNKDGMWTSEDARENFLQYESEGKSYTEVEIFTEVLGRKRVIYGADDARALQMMEEQQWKKDEELMQMMAKQQRKKDEEHRNDGGAAKDPSGTTRTEDATNGGENA
ncbi:hypothetical protein CJ030_MR5G001867 [Morella rubra]|uniref:Uncharacterized protein n=1 Tax=Morella rubra TaxID=262757 RepID=A0A6A1VJZ3_9ROSI|nr:hypothetical protein CJ030_MR5G001867 [Morella rubra]